LKLSKQRVWLLFIRSIFYGFFPYLIVSAPSRPVVLAVAAVYYKASFSVMSDLTNLISAPHFEHAMQPFLKYGF